MIDTTKRNCDNCFHKDVCTYKKMAVEFETKVNNLEDKPDIITVLIHCNEFSRKYGTGSNVKGTKEGTPKKLS